MTLVVPPGMVHADVQAKLREAVKQPGGAICPTCTQHAQIYRRQIYSRMARDLIALWRAGGTEEFVHAPTVLRRARGDDAKLRYWGLIEEESERRPDGGRTGYWRVTEKGADFVRGLIRLPKHALVYNGRLLGMDDSETCSIQQCLGVQFDYNELMAGG